MWTISISGQTSFSPKDSKNRKVNSISILLAVAQLHRKRKNLKAMEVVVLI
jgi:hypothetical protein